MKKSFKRGAIWALAVGLCIAGAVAVLYLATTYESKEPATNVGSIQGIEDISKDIQDRAGLQFKKKRLQLAIAVHEKVLKAAPDNPAAMKNLARDYYRLGKLEKKLGNEAASQENIAKARKLDPSILDTP